MKSLEYNARFLAFIKNKGVDHEIAVNELEASLECFGMSDEPEDDAREALSVWEQNS